MIPVVFEEHYERQYPERAIEVDLRTSRGALEKHADDMADSVAWKEIEAERAKWMRMLPAPPSTAEASRGQCIAI
jgi:ParB family chromosome partitioning protein